MSIPQSRDLPARGFWHGEKTSPSDRAPARTRAAAGGIAIVLHDLRGGGAERACLRLARGMVKAGRPVNLILVRGEGAYMGDIPEQMQVTVLDRSHVLDAVGALASHLRRTQPQGVLSALTHMNIATIAAAKVSGIRGRVVVSERNQISCKAEAASGLRERMAYRAAPLLYRAADAVVAVSHGVAEDVRRFCRLADGKVRVIHNPVFDADIEVKAREPACHPWFVADGPPIILGVGRLDRQKGFDVLLRAFALARARIDCRLVILGEGPERQALTAAAADMGIAYDVDMPGFVDNPFSLMARAGVFALSSRWEGFPNALVEAMACGAPVVSTDCPSGPREILEDGRYGTLVPVDDAQALGAALLASLCEPGRMESAQRRARRFHITTATAQYLDALEA